MIHLPVVFLILVFTLSACAGLPWVSSDEDFEDALYFSRVSNIAYLDLDRLEESMIPLELTLVKTNKAESNEVQFFLAKDTAGRQIIAIRGTASIEDAFIDADFGFVRNSNLGIQVHRGFDGATTRVVNELRPLLDKSSPIVITGHSLGGAVALLTGMHLHREGFQISHIYTYGQPRVTDKQGAALYKQIPVSRYVNHRDIVPVIPPASKDKERKWEPYWHLGREILLHSDNTSYSRLSYRASTLRGLSAYYANLIQERDMGAHSMVYYIEQLEIRANDTTTPISAPQ